MAICFISSRTGSTTTIRSATCCIRFPLTLKKALRWRDILFRCLRKRFLAPGLDALYRIEEERESATVNYYDKIGLTRDRFAEEKLEYIEGEL